MNSDEIIKESLPPQYRLDDLPTIKLCIDTSRKALQKQAQEIFKELEESIQDYEKVSGKNSYLETKKKWCGE